MEMNFQGRKCMLFFYILSDLFTLNNRSLTTACFGLLYIDGKTGYPSFKAKFTAASPTACILFKRQDRYLRRLVRQQVKPKEESYKRFKFLQQNSHLINTPSQGEKTKVFTGKVKFLDLNLSACRLKLLNCNELQEGGIFAIDKLWRGKLCNIVFQNGLQFPLNCF
jgi:hypothetical protein